MSATITEEQYAEVEAHVKTALAKGALQRFVSPSFPQELRLQVMKACVLQNASCWHSGPYGRILDMRNTALSSLLPSELWNPKTLRFSSSWLDVAPRDMTESIAVIADTAEQAFFENAIFKIDTTFTTSDRTACVACFEFSSPVVAVWARIHHLDIAVRVNVKDVALSEDGCCVRNAIRAMKSLKLHFLKLKTCVLTLNVHFAQYRVSSVLAPAAPPVKCSTKGSC